MESQEVKNLKKHNRQLRSEADYYQNIAAKTGKGRIKDVVQLSEVISQLNETKTKLEQSRKELESKVTERTEELARKNLALQQKIAEHRQVEQALRESETRFRSIFRDVPDAMVLANTDREIVLINPALTNIFGYTLEEIQGQQTVIFYESREEFEHQGRICFNLNAEENLKPYEVNYRRKNGEIFPGETVGTPIKDENDVTIFFLSVIRDISERKAAEKALEETNAALRVLLRTRQDDQRKFEEKILFHVKEMVLPHLEHLKNNRLSQNHLLHLATLEANLNDIVSSFSYTLSSKFCDLTPAEIQVANLVKQGRTSKEIALLLKISPKTVELHRYNIRKKLGLNRKKGNLRSLLISSINHL